MRLGGKEPRGMQWVMEPPMMEPQAKWERMPLLLLVVGLTPKQGE